MLESTLIRDVAANLTRMFNNIYCLADMSNTFYLRSTLHGKVPAVCTEEDTFASERARALGRAIHHRGAE